MADNVGIQTGVGATIATDDVSSVQHQLVKLEYGTDGVATMVSDSNPLPIDDAGGSITIDNAQLSVVGGGTEAAALRVTIANNSTGVLSVDDNGGSLTTDSSAEGATGDAAVTTDTTGTISGKLRGLVKWAYERMPASLGQKTMANSLAVVLASDQTTIPFAPGTADYTNINGLGSAVLYTSGDSVGGKLTLTTVLSAANKGKLRNFVATFASVDSGFSAFDLIIFGSNPSSSTITNNSPFLFDPTDIETVLFMDKFAAADAIADTNDNYVVSRAYDVDLEGAAQTIYAAVVVRGALLMVGSGTITFRFGIST